MLQIQNRRFLGNKYKLIDFIEEVIQENCPEADSLFDVFAGTGVVAHYFMRKMKVITNDILYSNYVTHVAYMSKQKIRNAFIKTLIHSYNKLHADTINDNYMSKNFADTYFSYEDCKIIGYVRENIESLHKYGCINEREKAVLVTVLLYSMDKIAHTCGHYDAYRKNVESGRHLFFEMLDLNVAPIGNNVCYNDDSNRIVKEHKLPHNMIAYIDPPYNSRNYSDLYHVLENVARWEKPEVFGVAKKMDRTNLKSKYCSKAAIEAFEELVLSLNCKCIILSYNNTATKANDRSNARMSDEDIMRILSKKGEVRIYSKKYKAFTTGKSKNDDNEERLFVCNVYPVFNIDEKSLVKSPLNYTGCKYKLLPQLKLHFPSKIDTFVGIFAGSGTVGANVTADTVIYNDINCNVIGLLRLMDNTSYDSLVSSIEKVISDYGLSDTTANSYAYYGCNSSSGMGNYNKAGFMRLREDFNKLVVRDDNYYVKLFVLVIYAFNNQIRFNAQGKYNLPVGKRDFNKVIRNNLKLFQEHLRDQNKVIISKDFRDFDLNELNIDTFIYCDPPYTLGTASYNEQAGWTMQDENDLLEFLDKANSKGIKFALSNVFEHKGKTNKFISKWAEKYKVHYLNHSYANASYHGNNTDKVTQEVLITNY